MLDDFHRQVLCQATYNFLHCRETKQIRYYDTYLIPRSDLSDLQQKARLLLEQLHLSILFNRASYLASQLLIVGIIEVVPITVPLTKHYNHYNRSIFILPKSSSMPKR